LLRDRTAPEQLADIGVGDAGLAQGRGPDQLAAGGDRYGLNFECFQDSAGTLLRRLGTHAEVGGGLSGIGQLGKRAPGVVRIDFGDEPDRESARHQRGDDGDRGSQ
jgi:hypothetical protein